MIAKMKIKSVIVEDEIAARNTLKSYLSKYCPQIEVVGEAQNSKEAVTVLHEVEPQLIFLDVEMPYGNAFDVLDACQDINFETIFDIEELIIAVNKVQHHLQEKDLLNRNKILLENMREPKVGKQQVILPTLEGFDVVRMEEIIRLQGNGNFKHLPNRKTEKNGLQIS